VHPKIVAKFDKSAHYDFEQSNSMIEIINLHQKEELDDTCFQIINQVHHVGMYSNREKNSNKPVLMSDLKTQQCV
jgi:hypothetical protein